MNSPLQTRGEGFLQGLKPNLIDAVAWGLEAPTS
jgi:hypothetical protein